MNDITSPLYDLRKMVIAQKTATLPSQPPSPEMEQLHNTLVMFDQIVSQVVIQVMQGNIDEFPKEKIDRLRFDLDSFFSNLSDGNRNVEGYRKYKQRLEKMSDPAEQVILRKNKMDLR